MDRNPARKVYVVDDDDASRHALDLMLRAVGYEVELFSNGTAFLERAAEETLSGCIVLDVRMQGLSGLEVQKRLTASGVTTPVIFLTGYADVPMAVQAMKANAVEFLTKPFRDQDLFDAIGSAMEQDSNLLSRSMGEREANLMLERLTSREYQVFLGFCQGHVSKEIAHDLDLAEATVKVHRRSILRKLEVRHMNELILTYGPLLQAGKIRPA